jgi:hypothetical protein
MSDFCETELGRSIHLRNLLINNSTKLLFQMFAWPSLKYQGAFDIIGFFGANMLYFLSPVVSQIIKAEAIRFIVNNSN